MTLSLCILVESHIPLKVVDREGSILTQCGGFLSSLLESSGMFLSNYRGEGGGGEIGGCKKFFRSQKRKELEITNTMSSSWYAIKLRSFWGFAEVGVKVSESLANLRAEWRSRRQLYSADPDPGSGDFLTTGSRISDPRFQTHIFQSIVNIFWIKSMIWNFLWIGLNCFLYLFKTKII